MFWIIGLAVIFAFGIFSAESNSALLSLATFLSLLGIVTYGFSIPLFPLIVANPLILIGAILAYTAVGAVYTALWRWPDFIQSNKDYILENYTSWAKMRFANEDASFDAYMDSPSYKYAPANHKERLGTWVGMWPFDATWEVSRKPAIWFWNVTYTSLGSMFTSVGKRAARNMYKDM